MGGPLFLFAILGLGATGPATLQVDERVPAVMMVMTPRGPASAARTTEILNEASAVLRDHTGLSLASIEQAGINADALKECPRETQLGCWASAVLSAYQSHRRPAKAAAMKRQVPAYLLVVSVLAAPNHGDRFSSLLIDLNRVREIDEGMPAITDAASDAGSVDRARRKENLIYEEAVQSKRGFALVEDANGLRAYLHRLLTRQFRGVFERNRHWSPFAEVLLKAQAGLIIRLDGEVLATLAEAETQLAGLLPGRRRIELLHPENLMVPFRVSFNLRSGERVIINADIIPRASPAVESAKRVMLWTGLAGTVAGLGLLTFALTANPNVRFAQTCSGSDCEPLSSTGFRRFCDYSEPASDCGGSPRIAPLGYSLVLAGTFWSASAFWGDEQGQFRWWGSLAGVAAGALSYGLSVALEDE